MKKVLQSITGMALIIVLVCGCLPAAAYEFAAIKQESDENVLEIEAEDFVRGGGFEITDDNTASGGKCITGKGTPDQAVEFDLSFDTDISRFIIYVVHKADSNRKNLSYISINHFERYSLYDYTIGQWNSTRMFYGDVYKGNYTVKISSVRAGQKIDKLIVKYQKSKSSSGVAATPISDAYTYLKGNEAYESLNITEGEERVEGSFFFEAEEGNISEKTKIGYDENASGGAYWYAPADEGLAHLTDVYQTDEIFSRFKFKVTRKGNYVMFVRYFTPQAMQKTTWFGINDENYWRLEDNFSEAWEWMKGTTRYLDVGWHTLDIKHRQPGQRIDCIILSDASGFAASGLGSLPGEPVRLSSEDYGKIEKVAAMAKLKVNNYRCKLDCPFVVIKNDMLVPATNLFNMMALELEEYDGYYIVKQDRNYIKFYMDSDRVIINGRAKNTGVKAYKFEGIIPMVPLSAVKEAFGLDFDYNEKETTLNIYYQYEENYREAGDEELIIHSGDRFFFYEIPCDDPNARVELWYKYNLTDNLALSRQNYDNMNSIRNGGINYQYQTNTEWKYWRRAITPYYKDGAFHGSAAAHNVEPTDVKVKIVSGGTEDTFIRKNAFTPENYAFNNAFNLSAEEYAYKTGGELLLVPTFENMSYYIDHKDENSTCKIRYRALGTETWREAYKPVYDSVSGQFRGSIVFLSEDTEYEVQAEISDISGKVISVKSAQSRTWTSNPPIAQTIKLSEIYSGSGPLLLQDIRGSEEGWIKIIGDSDMDTINATKNQNNEAVLIANCSYLIFEKVTVRGGARHCINVNGGSENIRIINCDIAEWGPEGMVDKEFGGYARESYFANNLAGIYVMRVKNLVVERCYIHDTDMNANAWDTDTWKNVHPKGGTGIQLLGISGMVIRYNDIIGSDEHRFNDVMEGSNNNSRNKGSTGSDADVYGNMMIYSEDDSIELDGGQMNVRVYYNRMEQSRCGVSTAPNTMGPSYIFYNQITNLGGTYNNASGSAVKAGGSPDGVFGMQFYFNNTMDSEATGPKNINYSGSSEFHSVTRNNIFVTRIGTRTAFSNLFADGRDDNDYDLIAGGSFDVKEGDESHGIFSLPAYVDLENGKYRLAAESPGAGAGTYIANFNEVEKPGMGAYGGHGGENMFMPFRPVDMYADCYYAKITDGIEREIKVHVGKIGEGRSYSLVKNRDFNWLEIISGNGTENIPLEEDSTITFKIKGDMSKCKFTEGKGMVLFRLDNGYSIPITVYCK